MDYEEFVKKLGRKIKEIRISKGITQEGMDEGDHAISHRTVQDIENGQSHPSVRSIFKIAKRLEVEPNSLFSFENGVSKRKQKISGKDHLVLHQYFKNASIIKNQITKIYTDNPKDQLAEVSLYLNLWFNFLYIIIDTAIFRFNIKEEPFRSLYDFEKNKWKDDLIPKLKASNEIISSFNMENQIDFKGKEIESLILFAGVIHTLISKYFQEEKLEKVSVLSG